MISREVIFDRLHKMSPSEVASIIKNALIEANIENDSEVSGIHFESLLPNNYLQTEYVCAFWAEEYSADAGAKRYLGSDAELDDDYLLEFDSSFHSIVPENDSIQPVAA